MAADAALKQMSHALDSASIVIDTEIRESYASDESEARPVVPVAVLRPKDAAEVAEMLRSCTEHQVSLTTRAGGTSRVGGAVPEPGGVVLSTERMPKRMDIERENLRAFVSPNIVLKDLHAAVEAEGLFYGPDPNSLETCQLGGNIGANAGGPRAFKYGVTQHWVLGMDVTLADGTSLSLGKGTSKGVTGYDLTSMLVGSEGTLGVVTDATLKLIPKPEALATLLVFLPNQATLQRAISSVLGKGVIPRCLEFLDALALDIARASMGLAVPPDARAMLLLELDGPSRLLDAQVEECGNTLIDAGALDVLMAQSSTERERLWAARREMSYAFRRQAKFKLSEDVVVPRTHIGELLRVCEELSDRHGVQMPSYGHAGDGNLHVNFLWDDPEDRRRVDAAIHGLFEAVVEMGGTLSGEHGIGILKAPYLALEQSPELIALQRRIKTLFDPRGILNPGKVFSRTGIHRAC